MAIEPGGFADKLGNRYEGRWVARQLLHLLAEQITTVQIEAVGDNERGVDLWVTTNDHIRVAQQCKLRNAHAISWSPATLQSRGVLEYAKFQLEKDTKCLFQLVTVLPSATLEELCRSARNSSGIAQEFYEHQVNAIGDSRRSTFSDLCDRLGLDIENPIDLEKAYDFLGRFEINTWPDNSTTRDDLRALANYWVNGKPDAVLAALCEFAITHLRRVIDAPMLRHYLRSLDLPPRSIDHDPRLADKVELIRERFRGSISDHLINGSLIQRKESTDVIESLDDKSMVLLLGEPGVGKSGVLFELVEHFENSKAIYLPIRLDRQSPSGSTSDFGKSLGLPGSPVRCLHSLAGESRCVLILDQLDALRWTASHSRVALDVCRELLREVHGLRLLGVDICVVMACRTYDRRHDPEIRRWLDANKEHWPTAEIVVKGLSPDDVQRVIVESGFSEPKFSSKQLELLASPQNLSLWTDLALQSSAGQFNSRAQLLRMHWELKQRELFQLGANSTDVTSALSRIVSFMESRGCFTTPVSILDEPMRGHFLAAGILDRSGTQLAFSHQSQLDYQVASRVLSGLHSSSVSFLDWLGSKDRQTLFRREQLRYALSLLADEDEPSFRNVVISLLNSVNIRFHLKQLCLEVVGQLATPSRALVSDILSLHGSPLWAEHIYSTVFLAHAPFVQHLIEMDVLKQWLADINHRNKAFWLLRSVAEAIPDDVASLLKPYADIPELRESVLGALAWNVKDDSDEMFALRLQLARGGIYQRYINWRDILPERRLSLLKAVLDSMDLQDVGESSEGRRSRIEHLSQQDLDAFLEAARDHPEVAWQISIEAIGRLSSGQGSNKNELSQWLDPDQGGLRQGIENLPYGLVRVAIESGTALARVDSTAFWKDTELLQESSSPIIQIILAESFEALAPALAERVIVWILADTHRFELGLGVSEPKWFPAQRLIRTHEQSCSDALIMQLESAIIQYRPRSLVQNAQYWLSTWKRGYFGDYWGRCQFFLLQAIPLVRLSTTAISLLGVLERKYEQYDEKQFVSGINLSGGSVGSSLGKNAETISDAAWLQIVANKEILEDRGANWRQIDDDNIVESSIRQFSMTLLWAAKRQPDRFARLCLRFPEDVHPWYVSAVLDAVRMTAPDGVPEDLQTEWEPVGCDIAEQVLERFANLSNRQMAMSFCSLLGDRAEDPWSDVLLDRLMELAHSHPDPEQNSLGIGNKGTNNFDANQSTPSDLTTNSLNSVRAAAGLAIGSLLRNKPEYLTRFMPSLESLCQDGHPAVRTAAVTACLPVLQHDKDVALKLFVKACRSDLRVAATHHAVYFFNTGMATHASTLCPLVDAMLQSEMPEVSREGAREVAARWLFHELFQEELNTCRTGSEALRIGVANIMSQFVAKPEYHSKAFPFVKQFLSDQSQEVRAAAYRCVRDNEILSTEYGRLIVAECVCSPAFADDPTYVLYALDDQPGSLLPFADIIFATTSRFAGDLADASRDISRGVGLDADKIGRLLLRLYEEAETDSLHVVRNGCLDAWDALLQARVGVRNMFEE